MHLPSRPWIRDDIPVAWRSDTSVEMGYPPRAARVDGVDRAHVTWLISLRGERTMTEALEAGLARGLSRSTMNRLARAAIACGLLDDAAAVPAAVRSAPGEVRDRIAGERSVLRQIHGADAHRAVERRVAAEVAVHGDNALADAVAMALACAGVEHIVRARSIQSGSRRHRRSSLRRTCEVICTGGHPDAASLPDAMALDIPHLAVCAAGPRAVIGPMVIPGRTSCLRCRDLHLSDADPTWPRAAVQWSARRRVSTSAPLAQMAGAWAALQVLALIDAGSRAVSAPTIDGALIVTLPEASPRIEPRPSHPLCGCRWPRTGHGVRG